MKPTPSKMVLLMSAAGLGLSWSGVALASRDGNAPASFALTFGIAPRSEPNCEAPAPDGWASCHPAQAELVRTIVADAAALPLPMAAIVPASDTKVSLQALHGYAQRPAEVRAADDEPKPNDKAPLPETPAVTARVIDGSSRDHEADAIAMVLLEDPREIAGGAATDSEPIARLPFVPETMAAGSSADERHRVGKGDRSAKTTAGESRTGASFADDRSSDRGAQAATNEGPALVADSASVELVLASLAEVLGAQFDERAADVEAKHQQATAPVHEAVFHASAASAAAPEPAQLVSAPAVDVRGSDSSSLQRASEADEIVVAPSHSDKILMSLAALRSGEGSEPGQLGAQTKKTVVVRHTDKVLETLALFQSRKPKRTALACTGVSDEEARVPAIPAESQQAWDLEDPTRETAMAGIGREPDILLDLLPPIADKPEKSALQAGSAQATPPELPAAAPREPSAIGRELVALSADKLDEVRGGFVTDGGLKISFGIERAVYLNGALVTTTSLNIADLSKISGGQAPQVTGNGTAGSLALVQSGTGNIFVPVPGSISSTAAGTVIQNTRDNQTINTITRIDAAVNSSGIMRGINLQSSMQSAIVNSLRR